MLTNKDSLTKVQYKVWRTKENISKIFDTQEI